MIHIRYSLIILFFFFLFSFFSKNIFAQGEINDEEKILFRDEKTFAFLANTNGFGMDYRYARRLSGFKWRLFDIDFALLKNPKEIKLSYNYGVSTSTFIYGKQNEVFALRCGIGVQKELFSKFDKGGIAIRRFWSLGGSVALEKPIYYEVSRDLTIVEEKFDLTVHTPDVILGKAGFFKGFKEINAVPGTYAKFGFSFEYSKKDNRVLAIETGILGEFYLFKPEIMAGNGSHFHYGLFACFRWGKVINSWRYL